MGLNTEKLGLGKNNFKKKSNKLGFLKIEHACKSENILAFWELMK